MRRLMRRTGDEGGFALVLALLVLAALAAGLTTAIMVSSSSGHTATRASADQVAYNAAEAGVNLAMSTLHASNTNALNPNALPSTTTDFPVGCDTATTCTGWVTWSGSFDSNTLIWTITSTGYARNQSGIDLPDRSRTLTATSQVQYDLTQTVNNQVWNYIYGFGSGSPTSCDVNLEQNAIVTAPIYTEGNLCLQNNSAIEGEDQPDGTPPTPVNVVVKGKVVYGTKTYLGTSADPIIDAHLAGGCGSSFSNTHTCSTSTDPIHLSGVLDTSPPTVTVPQPDFAYYYQNANPGPMHPCNSSTASNPPAFDSDSNQDLATNGNAAAFGTTTANTFNLTPSFSYTCQGFDGSGTKVGEISWNASTKKLTVQGVIYYDGNLTVSSPISSYSGQATFYATGYMTMPGTKMCGAIDSAGTDCDYNPGEYGQTAGGWDPNHDMLIVAVNGEDSSGNGINFSSPGVHWQGGLYSNESVYYKNQATIEGPVIARYLDFNQNVVSVPFPVITSVPVGAPGNPNAYADALPPTITG